MKVNSQEVHFTGAAGNIQGILDIPSVSAESRFISVNCHPHSLHGGSMTNKVVYTVSRSIAGLGIPSLRFNFRGVGLSEGDYDHGKGEQIDLASAVNWMKAQYPERKLILSGFSFGAYVSALASCRIAPSFLLSVAPPVQRFDFADFIPPNAEWAVIMGDEDELVDFSAVENWLQTFVAKPQLVRMQGASHFFHGRLVELRQHIESLVEAHLKR